MRFCCGIGVLFIVRVVEVRRLNLPTLFFYETSLFSVVARDHQFDQRESVLCFQGDRYPLVLHEKWIHIMHGFWFAELYHVNDAVAPESINHQFFLTNLLRVHHLHYLSAKIETINNSFGYRNCFNNDAMSERWIGVDHEKIIDSCHEFSTSSWTSPFLSVLCPLSLLMIFSTSFCAFQCQHRTIWSFIGGRSCRLQLWDRRDVVSFTNIFELSIDRRRVTVPLPVPSPFSISTPPIHTILSTRPTSTDTPGNRRDGRHDHLHGHVWRWRWN